MVKYVYLFNRWYMSSMNIRNNRTYVFSKICEKCTCPKFFLKLGGEFTQALSLWISNDWHHRYWKNLEACGVEKFLKKFSIVEKFLARCRAWTQHRKWMQTVSQRHRNSESDVTIRKSSRSPYIYFGFYKINSSCIRYTYKLHIILQFQ